MKKIRIVFFALLIVMSVFTCFLTSCDNKEKEENQKEEKQETVISFAESSKNILFGDEEKLSVVGGSVDTSKYIWTSMDENVVTVSHGTVTAVGQGETDIKVVDGNSSATCHIVVSFGDLLPSLIVSNISNDSVIIKKGEDYKILGKVYFNGKLFDTELNVTSEDSDVCSVLGNTITGNKVGTTNLSVVTTWNGFDNEFLKKNISVKVDYNVNLYSEIEINGETEISDKLDLSLVDSWCGNTYVKSAKINAVVIDDGERKDAELILTEDGILEKDGNTITANKVGSTAVSIEYTNSDSQKFSITVEVNVTCPVVEYSDTADICTSENFDLAKYFGATARIISAKQGNNKLKCNGSKITGIVPNGYDTEDIEICTTNGGYLFTNVFAYTMNLTADNFVSALKYNNKAIEGYYIMKDDIPGVIDMTSQVYATNKLYFTGTFNGLGHTVNVKVSRAGVFGELKDASIINTHFNFTFDTTNGLASGLADGNATYTDRDYYINLENLYITTTNYKNNTYSLFNNRYYSLKMNNVLVVLNNVENDDFTDCRTQEVGALFHNDHTSITGPYGMFTGEFTNIYVVSSKFMPMSNTIWTTEYNYINFAKNDISKLGSVVRSSDDSSNLAYCKVFSSVGDTKLFGKAPWDNTDGYVYYAWLYESTVTNGGIVRYDTIPELIKSGVTQVGTWNVE